MDKSSGPEDIYNILFSYYGPRGWWPLIRPGGTRPEYFVTLERREQIFEVAVGAVLTQNTAWSNAAGAVAELNRTGNLSPRRILDLDQKRLAGIIHSSGYYNMKARKLKALARFFSGRSGDVTRDDLLSVYGIGPETADSILLYGFGEPAFVVDTYTGRIFGRIGILKESMKYDRIREYFELNLPRDPALYGEYHALIVEHAKKFCRRSPLCGECPLNRICRHRPDSV